MNNTIRISVALAVLAVFVVMALGSSPPPITRKNHGTTDFTPQEIKYGRVVNEDLKIVSKEGKFTLEGGEQFDTPFQVYWWKGQGLTGTDTREGHLVNAYDKAARRGGQRVLVYQEGSDEPLHGVLVLNSAIKSAFGPATRSYYVKIPEQKLNTARHGNIAVAYEKMDWRETWENRAYRGSTYLASKSRDRSKEKTWYSWILWLSATPI